MVGGTDPIRDNYDGPFLNIVRHYPIDKVYLFLTKEMSERDKKDDRYARSLKSINDSIIVKKFHTKITNPHKDEPLASILKQALESVYEDHQEDTLYFNLSSGTPQMRSVLSHLIVITDITGHTLEVASPRKGQNTSEANFDDYSVDDHIELNMDAVEDTENRVFETNLLKYRQLMVYSQVKALVDKYEYQAAIELLHKSKLKTSLVLMNALNHAHLRIQLKKEEANKWLCSSLMKQASHLEIGLSLVDDLSEYFMIIEIKNKKTAYADMVLMLEPFMMRFLETVFLEKANLDVRKEFMIKNKKKRYQLSPDKIEEYNSKLLEKLNRNFGGSFKQGDPSIRAYGVISEHLFKKEKNRSLFELLDKVDAIKKLRDNIAHNLKTTDDKEINNFVGMNSNYLINYFREKFKEILGVSEKDLSAYTFFNETIKEQLNTLI